MFHKYAMQYKLITVILCPASKFSQYYEAKTSMSKLLLCVVLCALLQPGVLDQSEVSIVTS